MEYMMKMGVTFAVPEHPPPPNPPAPVLTLFGGFIAGLLFGMAMVVFKLRDKRVRDTLEVSC